MKLRFISPIERAVLFVVAVAVTSMFAAIFSGCSGVGDLGPHAFRDHVASIESGDVEPVVTAHLDY